MEAHQFELDGGRVCLDFVNTVGGTKDQLPRDRLGSYADLVAFAAQSKVVTAQEAKALLATAAERPQHASRALGAARQLRDALFEIFSAVVERRAPPEDAVATLNGWIPRTMKRLEISPAGEGWRWRLVGDCDTLDGMLFPIVRSASDLLTSDEELADVRACESPTCVWYFLDETKNRSRRWCSMSSCGNREKARRFHARHKQRSA